MTGSTRVARQAGARLARERHDDQSRGDGRERQRIGRRHVMQEASEQPRGEQRDGNAGYNADRCERQTARRTILNTVTSIGADGDPDPYFAGAAARPGTTAHRRSRSPKA